MLPGKLLPDRRSVPALRLAGGGLSQVAACLGEKCRICRASCDFKAIISDGNTVSVDSAECKGCGVCNGTGYKGRVGLYEVMEVSDGIRELILVGASSQEIRKKADGVLAKFKGTKLYAASNPQAIQEKAVRVSFFFL